MGIASKTTQGWIAAIGVAAAVAGTLWSIFGPTGPSAPAPAASEGGIVQQGDSPTVVIGDGNAVER